MKDCLTSKEAVRLGIRSCAGAENPDLKIRRVFTDNPQYGDDISRRHGRFKPYRPANILDNRYVVLAALCDRRGESDS